VFKFDPEKLGAAIEAVDEERGRLAGYQKGMKLIAIGSVLKGDFTTATLGLGFASQTANLTGIRCPECGWETSWDSITKAIAERVREVREKRELEKKTTNDGWTLYTGPSQEERRVQELRSAIGLENSRLMLKLAGRFGKKELEHASEGTRVAILDSELRVMRVCEKGTWVGKDIWFCWGAMLLGKARTARWSPLGEKLDAVYRNEEVLGDRVWDAGSTFVFGRVRDSGNA
jgi:hypothetical protein